MTAVHKLFHPLQSPDINVIGRLIQQKDMGISHEDSRHLQLDFLSAGELSHLLLGIVNIRRYSKLPAYL